jgi:hypothetical protein
MPINNDLLNKLYPNKSISQQRGMEASPSPVKLVVTNDDVDNKVVTRYFIKSANSNSQLMEIDAQQFAKFKTNNRFLTIKIDWKIVGNPKTNILPNGVVDLGVEDYNKEQVRKADITFGGLSTYIRDYLEFWYSDDFGNRTFVRETQPSSVAKRPVFSYYNSSAGEKIWFVPNQTTVTPTVPTSPSPTAPITSPSPTPSVTPSATGQLTPSVTPSVTPSLTPSVTPSFTPSLTPSVTPSVTPNPTPSVTPSFSPSLTPSVTPSFTPSLTPTPSTIPLTLTRTSSGKLAAHTDTAISGVTTAFNAADWGPKSNVSVSTSLTTLDFTSLTSNIFRTMPYAPIVSRSQAFLQSVGQAVNSAAAPGVFLRGDSGSVEYDGVWSAVPAGFSGPLGVREINNGSDIASNTITRTLSVNTSYRVSGATDAGSGSIGYVFAGTGFATASSFPLTLTRGGGVYSGLVGLIHSRGTAGTTRYSEFYAMTSRYLTVSGLPTSASVEIRNSGGTVLVSGSEAAGTATVDMLTVTFPTATEIRILDSGSNVLITATPSDRIWGGDAWVYA